MTDTNAPQPQDTAATTATDLTATTTATSTAPASTPAPAANTTTAADDTNANTTTSTTTTSTSPPVPQDETRPKDPRIAALHAMFPDYDDLILYSVLDSVDGNQDRAIDALLGMSDPEYKPTEQPTIEPALTQTDLDEQLARRLLLEDQEAQQAAWLAQQDQRRPRWAAQQQQTQHQYQGNQQQDVQGVPGQGQGQGQGGDTMAEIQQQLGKFAETGKKTFGTLFNKVKAKIQEMDQSRTSSPSQQWDPAGYEQSTYQNQSQPHVPYATRPPHGAQSSHSTTPAQQPAYYDPNPDPVTTPSPPVQGYDAAPVPQTTTASSTIAPPSNDTLRTSGLASPPIDGGKLGLLPKRPVALLRPGESTQIQRQHSQDESDDGLEYAESPFEETKPNPQSK